MVRLCLTAAGYLGSAHTHAIRELHAWIDGGRDAPIDLLDALIAPDGPRSWLGNALPSAYQALQSGIQRAASDPDHAGRFTGEVDRWLDLSGYAGDLRTRADELRLSGIRNAPGIGRPHGEPARRVLDCVETATAARMAGESGEGVDGVGSAAVHHVRARGDRARRRTGPDRPVCVTCSRQAGVADGLGELLRCGRGR